jgi:hypothetical protein
MAFVIHWGLSESVRGRLNMFSYRKSVSSNGLSNSEDVALSLLLVTISSGFCLL